MPGPKPKMYRKTKSTKPVNPHYDRDHDEDVEPKKIPEAPPFMEGRKEI